MIKKKKSWNDKEERTSLKDNNEVVKKKKVRQIALQKINLGTKPINISQSKYPDIFDNSKVVNVKGKMKIISIVAIVVIVIIIFLTLKGKFHHQDNDVNENNKILINELNSTLSTSSPIPSINKNDSSPSPSSSKKIWTLSQK